MSHPNPNLPGGRTIRPSPVLAWVHAVTLLVLCPVWAGWNVTVLVGQGAGAAVFATAALIGAVVVWRHRDGQVQSR